MVNLLDLPNEILLQIVYETLPDGIEALSRCSNRASILSREALIQHEADKKKYRYINLPEDEDPGPLLIDVVQNPRRGQYARSAILEFCRQDVRVPLDKDITDVLTQTLVQQPCVPLTELPHWIQEATSGNQDIIVAILLLLLPNIETLCIPSTGYCESLIRRLVKWSQESVVPQPNLPLARLQMVIIGDDEWDSGRPAEYLVDHGLTIFQGLPSLRSITCFYRTSRAFNNPNIVLEYSNGCTELQIYDYELSSAQLQLILQHVENLTAFEYLDRFRSDATRNLDIILQSYAGRSLEELKIYCLPTPLAELPSHGFHSLTGFTVLKKITITLDTIRCGENTSSSRPSLVEFLPSSVEEITVIGPTTCQDAKKVLDELAHAKAVHFPGLKKVHMMKTRLFSMAVMKVAFEKSGIIMDLDHGKSAEERSPDRFSTRDRFI